MIWYRKNGSGASMLKLALVLVIAFSLVACSNLFGGDDNDDNGGGDTTGDGNDDGTDDGGSNSGSYVIDAFRTTTQVPAYVNVFFQVETTEGEGVSDLTTSDFVITDDGRTPSITESAPRIKKADELPYTIRTVLMLDNTVSIGQNLPSVREAAKALVEQADATDKSDRDGSTGIQSIAVYTFDDQIEQVQGFTNNVQTLLGAIDTVELGVNTTNLYGAVHDGIELWDDVYATDGVTQGFLVILTDGEDTAGKYTESFIQNKVRSLEKRVLAVGVGSSVDQDTLTAISSADPFTADDFDQLAQQFVLVQSQISDFANSFYNLFYLTSGVDAGTRTLKLSIEGNTNPNSQQATYSTTYDSSDMWSVGLGIHVNDTFNNREGVDSFSMGIGRTRELNANIYLGENGGLPNEPEFSVSSSPSGLTGTAEAYADQPEGSALRNLPQYGAVISVDSTETEDDYTLTITDSANNQTKELTVSVVDPLVEETFDSKEEGWTLGTDWEVSDGALRFIADGTQTYYNRKATSPNYSIPDDGIEYEIAFDNVSIPLRPNKYEYLKVLVNNTTKREIGEWGNPSDAKTVTSIDPIDLSDYAGKEINIEFSWRPDSGDEDVVIGGFTILPQ